MDLGEKPLQYPECLLNLPPHLRRCGGCEKLEECAHGLKVIRGEISGDDSITQGLAALDTASKGEDSTLAELRSGPCLLGYPPIFRSCATCPKLYECLHGQKVVYGDMSITDKVLKLDMIITDVSELRSMSLEQLREYNAARDTYEKRGLGRKHIQGLTAGAYDREIKKWVTNVLTGDAENVAGDSVGKGLMAGYWDAEKKRWVAKK